MAKLVSTWYRDGSLPDKYIFPPESRPGKSVFPLCNSIPVVDLSDQSLHRHNRADAIQQILKASTELGFFQVINHGVSENLMNDAMSVFEEFFQMPQEQKEILYSEELKKCQLCTSSPNYNHEKIHYWRENLRHQCHPIEQYINDWPATPSRYRDIVGAYCVEARKLGSMILDLIAEGLRLESGFFDNKRKGNVLLSVNHYPPCPDPSLTLRISGHCDPNPITILLQGDVSGLQFFVNGEWMTIQPLPNALLINVGYALQVISNNKLKGGLHRVITNSQMPRTSAAFFISPTDDCIVEPAKDIVDNESNPPLFKAFKFEEFKINFLSANDKGYTVLDPYKLHA